MEPAIKPAILHSKTWVVGVLATAWTFKGALYHRTLTQFKGDIKVIEEVGDWLVELVEANEINSKKAEKLLVKHLTPMIDANVDHIVLWCTHYPFLQPIIEKILKERKIWNKITIVNPAPAVALQAKRILPENKEWEIVANHERKFYSTWNEKILQTFVENIISELSQNNIKLPTTHFEHLSL